MQDYKEIEKLNLADEKALNEVLKFAKDLISWKDAYLARGTFRALEGKLLKTPLDTDTNNKYQKIINQLKFVAFPHLTLKEVEALVRDYFTEALELDLDLLSLLRLRLLSLPYDEAEQLKIDLSKILDENDNLVTAKNLIINEREEKPSIKNWLRTYRSEVNPREEEGRTLRRASYFSSYKNLQQLTRGEKEKIKKLIYFYEFINTASIFPEGYADDLIIDWGDGELSILDDYGLTSVYYQAVEKEEEEEEGEEEIKELVEENEVKSKVLPLPDEVKKAYQGDPKLQNEIEKEEKNLQDKVKGEVKILRDEFFKAVQLRSQARTIASFRLLAKLNDLDKFLAEDEKLKKFLSTTWTKKYGQKFTDEFEKNPAQAKYIKAFLRYVLEERLGLSEDDSGRVAAKLVNVFKQQGLDKYKKIAYFDLKEKKFKFFADTEH